MPCLPYNALDNVLVLCPNLRYLLIAADYISSHLFDEGNARPGHPLRQLDLESSGHLGVDMKIEPNEIFFAVAEERLTGLRVVRVSQKLGWTVGAKKQDAEDLGEMLETVAREAGEKDVEKCGVYELPEWGGWRDTGMCT